MLGPLDHIHRRTKVILGPGSSVIDDDDRRLRSSESGRPFDYEFFVAAQYCESLLDASSASLLSNPGARDAVDPAMT